MVLATLKQEVPKRPRLLRLALAREHPGERPGGTRSQLFGLQQHDPGAASGGMVGVLLAFGVEADLALGSVLAYRSVAIWLPAPIGLVALGGLRRTFARWAEEDASGSPLPAAPWPAANPVRARLQRQVWSPREAAVEVPA